MLVKFFTLKKEQPHWTFFYVRLYKVKSLLYVLEGIVQQKLPGGVNLIGFPLSNDR
jgi:hypothetical protein